MVPRCSWDLLRPLLGSLVLREDAPGEAAGFPVAPCCWDTDGARQSLGEPPCSSPSSLSFSSKSFEAFVTSQIRGSEARCPQPWCPWPRRRREQRRVGTRGALHPLHPARPLRRAAPQAHAPLCSVVPQIPRYILTLHELLAHTPHEHVERNSLDYAKSKLEELSRSDPSLPTPVRPGGGGCRTGGGSGWWRGSWPGCW